jgi:hypothetical protein
MCSTRTLEVWSYYEELSINPREISSAGVRRSLFCRRGGEPVAAAERGSIPDRLCFPPREAMEVGMSDRRDGSNVVRNENEARQGSKEGVVRYVLIGGLVLVVLAFAIGYGSIFG